MNNNEGTYDLIVVGAGLAGALLGPLLLRQMGDGALDSHFRYLSGLLLGIGLLFWSTIPNIERQGHRFGLLTTIVVVGGFCRALGRITEPDALNCPRIVRVKTLIHRKYDGLP